MIGTASGLPSSISLPERRHPIGETAHHQGEHGRDKVGLIGLLEEGERAREGGLELPALGRTERPIKVKVGNVQVALVGEKLLAEPPSRLGHR